MDKNKEELFAYDYVTEPLLFMPFKKIDGTWKIPWMYISLVLKDLSSWKNH